MKGKIAGARRTTSLRASWHGDSLDDRFAALEREEQVEALLRHLKEQHAKTA